MPRPWCLFNPPDRHDWFTENRDKVNNPEWLAKWSEFEELRPSFFELRCALDVHGQRLTPNYEYPTLGGSSVDFEINANGCQFLIEIVATNQTDSMTERTQRISEYAKMVATDPVQELRKVQGKIVRKVAKKVGKTEIYKPHKFPKPEEGGSIVNVLIADTRGFTGGDHLEQYERIQLVWGSLEYAQSGGSALNHYGLSGLFDPSKEGEEARLFRERIHLLGLVSEETFGPGEVIRQTRFYENPFLADREEPLSKFPLRSSAEPDPYGKLPANQQGARR
jgi:hypothetical protein